jgi:hypothetical protein
VVKFENLPRIPADSKSVGFEANIHEEIEKRLVGELFFHTPRCCWDRLQNNL